MCGIVGILALGGESTVDRDLLCRMRDTMVHRGPDGAGVWVSADRRVGLGHRRLSILDLSTAAANCRRRAWVPRRPTTATQR
jgi:asparagine synthase (glutamine-hydrolysing)